MKSKEKFVFAGCGRIAHRRADFPVANQQQEEFLSRLMYPQVTKEQIQCVSETIRSFYSRPS